MAAVAVRIAQKSGRRARAGLFEAATASVFWVCGRREESAARGSSSEGRSRSGLCRGVALALLVILPYRGPRRGSRARFPEDTSVQFMYLPTLRALFSLDIPTPDATAAIQALHIASATISRLVVSASSDGSAALFHLCARTSVPCSTSTHRIRRGVPEDLDHRSIVLVDPMDAMARLQLRRALALAGETPRRKPPTTILLRRGRTPTPRYRWSRRHARNPPGCHRRRIPDSQLRRSSSEMMTIRSITASRGRSGSRVLALYHGPSSHDGRDPAYPGTGSE